MPRIARVVAVAEPHHVTQRGNNRQQVFFSKADRRVYLALLKAHCERWRLDVLGYCLMPNHVHLIVVPEAPNSLAKALGRTHYEYAILLQLPIETTGLVGSNSTVATAISIVVEQSPLSDYSMRADFRPRGGLEP